MPAAPNQPKPSPSPEARKGRYACRTRAPAPCHLLSPGARAWRGRVDHPLGARPLMISAACATVSTTDARSVRVSLATCGVASLADGARARARAFGQTRGPRRARSQRDGPNRAPAATRFHPPDCRAGVDEKHPVSSLQTLARSSGSLSLRWRARGPTKSTARAVGQVELNQRRVLHPRMRIGHQSRMPMARPSSLIAPDLAVASRPAWRRATGGPWPQPAPCPCDRAGGAMPRPRSTWRRRPTCHRGDKTRARLGYEDTHLARHSNVDIADIDGAARKRNQVGRVAEQRRLPEFIGNDQPQPRAASISSCVGSRPARLKRTSPSALSS